MKKGFSLARLRRVLLAHALKLGRLDRRILTAAGIVGIALLTIFGLTSVHHKLHPVTGPAGGSVTSQPDSAGAGLKSVRKRITVSPGDTLLGIFARAGIDSQDTEALLTALRPLFAPSDLQPDQIISLSMSRPDLGTPRVNGLQIDVDSKKNIVVTAVAPGQFNASLVPQDITYRPALVSGTIATSLYDAAQAAGLPLGILMEMIRAYSFDVDFQRDVHPGDSFDIVYERAYDSRGRYLSDGDMLFASLTVGGAKRDIYEFRTSDGYTDYFDASGQSVRKMLMRTPVQGAWISSVFGWRKNPVYGYSEFHRGLDFAVPMNTPIMAAGNGAVVIAGHDSDYGNYVELQHANGYRTLYGHMNAFARGIRAGAVVAQGQIIGYVGTTGMSTGPHLHYEVIYRGERINPATVVSPSGPALSGAELTAFLAAKQRIDTEYAVLEAGRPVRADRGVAENPSPASEGSRG